MALKLWVVIDFDGTIVDANTDRDVKYKLLQNRGSPSNIMAPFFGTGGHTIKSKQDLYDYLYVNGARKHDFDEYLDSVTLVPGMKDLINSLHFYSPAVKLSILSDSNTYFIDRVLTAHGLRSCVSSILANTAWFNNAGRLTVTRPDVRLSPCKTTSCSTSLCKTALLSATRKNCNIKIHTDADRKNSITNSLRRKSMQATARMVYIGDGFNDLCPVISLPQSGLAFAREKRSLARALHELMTGEPFSGKTEADRRLARLQKPTASVHYWTDGHQIWGVLENLIEAM